MMQRRGRQVRYASRAAKYLLPCSYLHSPLATWTHFPTEMGTLGENKKLHFKLLRRVSVSENMWQQRKLPVSLIAPSEALDDWNTLWEKNKSRNKPAVYAKNHLSMRCALYAELTWTYAQPLLTSSPPSSINSAHSTSLAPGWLHVGSCKTKQNWATRIRKKGAIP